MEEQRLYEMVNLRRQFKAGSSQSISYIHKTFSGFLAIENEY